MCKAIDDMKKEAADKAVENNRLESIKNLMETVKWTAEQAMNALKSVQMNRAGW